MIATTMIESLWHEYCVHNRMGDQFMNDNSIAYIGKEIFDTIDNEVVIIQQFQTMRIRQAQL